MAKCSSSGSGGKASSGGGKGSSGGNTGAGKPSTTGNPSGGGLDNAPAGGEGK